MVLKVGDRVRVTKGATMLGGGADAWDDVITAVNVSMEGAPYYRVAGSTSWLWHPSVRPLEADEAAA